MEQWYVLYSKPCKEERLRDQLAQKGLDVYLPMLPPTPRARRQIPVPLFPRYLFARIDFDETSRTKIEWTPGLSGFVTCGDELATVDEALLGHVKRRLSELRQDARPTFAPGQRVRLYAGHPLADLDAVFEKPMSDGKRAYVLLNVVGRLMRAEVPLGDLEPVDVSG